MLQRLLLIAIVIVCSLPLTVWAEASCLQGQWQYDADNSDNPERVLKKLLRKQKLALRRQYRHQGEKPPAEDNKAVWQQGLPAFVFSTENMQLSFEGEQATWVQGQQKRQWDLSGTAKPVSLTQLANQGYNQIAHWQGQNIVVETTMSNGQYVQETYSVKAGAKDKQLTITLLIRGNAGNTFELSKFYNAQASGCSAKS